MFWSVLPIFMAFFTEERRPAYGQEVEKPQRRLVQVNDMKMEKILLR